MANITDSNGHSVTVKQYIDAQNTALRELLIARIEATDRAACLAAEGLQHRLHAANEWRQQSKEREGQFFPRTEHDIYARRMADDIADLRKSRDQMDGKASQKSVNFAQVTGILGLFVSMIAVILAVALH